MNLCLQGEKSIPVRKIILARTREAAKSNWRAEGVNTLHRRQTGLLRRRFIWSGRIRQQYSSVFVRNRQIKTITRYILVKTFHQEEKSFISCFYSQSGKIRETCKISSDIEHVQFWTRGIFRRDWRQLRAKFLRLKRLTLTRSQTK